MTTLAQYRQELQSCETLQEIISYMHNEDLSQLDDIDSITREEWSNISYHLRQPGYICKDLFCGLYDMYIDFTCKCELVGKDTLSRSEPGKIHVNVKFTGPASGKSYQFSWFAYVD